jgi:hypothetical protein
MSTMTGIPRSTDPHDILRDGSHTLNTLRPVFRSLAAPITGIAITDFAHGGMIVIRVGSAPAARDMAVTLDLPDRTQVRTHESWVRSYEGTVGDAETRIRVVCIADGPADDCRTLTVGEPDAVAALLGAVVL